MAVLYDCLGLDDIFENEDTGMGLIQNVVAEGKPIVGYYGYPYFIKHYGDAEFVVRTIADENGQLGVNGFDTHARGNSVWDVRIAAFGEINSKNSDPLERRIGAYNNSTGKGLAIINLLNADVLPGFLPDDNVKMQIIGFAVDVNYYADEEEYAESVETTVTGQKYLVGNGTVFPIGFMSNRQPGLDSFEKADDYEDVNIVVGTVKRLQYGQFKPAEKSINTCAVCTIDTEFGPLEIVHSFYQVKENQRKNLNVGATIAASVILSGDVAIYEYDQGIIRNEENDLRCLRYSFEKGQAERLSSLLADDCKYSSKVSGNRLQGKSNIINNINDVHASRTAKYFCHMAVLAENKSSSELLFNEGKKCLVLADSEPDNFESIVFVDYDDEGQISEIIITNDSRYKFKIETTPEYDKPEYNNSQKTLEERLHVRACFYGFIDEKTEIDVYETMEEYKQLKQQAYDFIEISSMNAANIDEVYADAFGAAFAKAIKRANNYEIIDYGRQFYKDVKLEYSNDERKTDVYKDEVINALIYIQKIGMKARDSLIK